MVIPCKCTDGLANGRGRSLLWLPCCRAFLLRIAALMRRPAAHKLQGHGAGVTGRYCGSKSSGALAGNRIL